MEPTQVTAVGLAVKIAIRAFVGLTVAFVVLVAFIAFAPEVIKDKIADALNAVNPFHEETVDRTGPSVLISLTELSEYHAANAYYETVVDIEEDSRLPSFVKGERVLYVGKGDVDAIVDFSDLDEERVSVSEDRLTATIKLPPPTIDEPVLDLEESYVVEHDSGLADKFGGSDLEKEAQVTALDQMTEAATGGDALTDLARKNTVSMLRGLLGALGYVNVTVIWDDEPASEPSSPATPQ